MKPLERHSLQIRLLLAFLALALAFSWWQTPPRLVGEEQLRASLAALGEPVSIQWYASSPAEYTGERRAIARAVQRIEQLSGVRVQRIEPGSDPAQAAHAARLGLLPLRLRTIERDGWSETNLWSSLRVVSPSLGAWVCVRLGPQEAPELAVRMAAGLDQLREPRRARIGLRLPAQGFQKLENELAQRSELFLLGNGPLTALPESIDWLIYAVEPSDGAAQAALLEEYLARGGALLLLGSGSKTPASADTLLFGVCGAQLAEDPLEEPARSIASQQDFQPLGAQPNGTLFFGSAPIPKPLPGSTRRWHTLASDARSQPRLVLIQPGAGSVAGTSVLCVSQAPFHDAHFGDESLAHPALLRVLEREGADPVRSLAARRFASKSPPLPEWTAAERAWIRILIVLTLPLVCLLTGLLVLRREAPRGRASGWRREVVLIGLAGGLAALALLPSAAREPAPALWNRARELEARAGLQLDWLVSERERLPTAWRGALGAFELELGALAQAVPGVQLKIRRVPALDREQRAELERLEIESAWVRESEGDEQRTREIVASLRLSSGSAVERIDFHREQDLPGASFRLGFALERLLRGRPVRIAWRSPSLRLSPAEAQLQYLDRGLFAPGGSDTSLEAREFLRMQGFEVRRMEPQELEQPWEAELFVLLQPRRPSAAEQAAFESALQRGIPGIVAVQHFVAQSRTRGADPRASGWWPEPQFLDLEQGFFADCGLAWSRELLFDQQCARAESWSVVQGAMQRSTERVALANPWFPRVTGPGLEPAGMLSVGSFAMPQASILEWDSARAAARGYRVEPLLSSSPRTWTVSWAGGEIDPQFSREQAREYCGPRTLAVKMRSADGRSAADFLALGSSRCFEDGELWRPDSDNANALLEWCARATLAPDLCALLAERSRGAGLIHVPPEERLRLRALTLALPLLVLAGAFWMWRRLRA
jgi:hypothetical protein